MLATHSIENFTLTCTSAEEETSLDNQSLPEFLQKICNEHIASGRGNVAWTTDTKSGESFTIAEFDTLSRNIASALYKRGFRKGDVVTYMCYELVKLHTFFNGVWRANGIVRSIYAEEIEGSVLDVLNETNCRWILCDATEANVCLSVAKKIGRPLEVIVTSRNVEGCTSIYDLFEDDGKECPQLDVGGGDRALVLCTSGSTGRSKGALFSHKAVIAVLKHVSKFLDYSDRNIFISKAAHVSGSLFTFCCFVVGKTFLSIPRITFENILEAVKVYQPGFIFGFPVLLRMIAYDEKGAEINKGCFQYILTGGSNIPSNFQQELKKKFVNMKSITQVYGLTECVPVTWSTHRANADSPLEDYKGLPDGSLGKVAPGCSLQIRDANMKPLGPNQDGELCVKNKTMFSGYINKEEETAKALTQDGWLRSGDIGHYDENGFIFFSGRDKEMFKVMANHVFPAEIDEVVSQHPSVGDVCTIGIPDPAGEKIPRVFVTLKPDCSTSAEEIKEFAHKNLPVYKHLRGGLYIVSSLPRAPSGKISRLLVAEMPLPEDN